MNTQATFQKAKDSQSYCKFGSEILIKLLSGFNQQIQGVLENRDSEFVHKTRVTSRRLRAALPLFCFCFPKKQYKPWLKEIKQVTRLLASARDLDVQIVFIEQYIKKLQSNEDKASIRGLLRDHKAQRKNIQSAVADGLEELRSAQTLQDIHRLCEKTLRERATQVFDPESVKEKAHWHISFRLDDFLAMERYVHVEKEKLKHHEIRIYAKKLRYTMETFSSLYSDSLSKEIATIKAFQDVLGEMHDCDVWIDYIPKFIEKAKANPKSKMDTKTEVTLLNFLVYIKEQRKAHYKEFVHLWNENKATNFFDTIRENTKVGFAVTEEKIKNELEKPNSKIAVLSDVHANLHALQTVFADAKKRGVTAFLNAGDLIGFGAFPNEVVELLCEKNVLSVVGNYDLEVIEGKIKGKGDKGVALKFAQKELAKSCEYYLRSLPKELRLEVAGKKLLITHGSPQSIDEHIYQDTPVEYLKTLAAESKADVIIVGHSHEQFSRQINGAVFVNPGSVGRPGDGNPKAAYAVLSFNPFKVELGRLKYDVEAAADALRKRGLPESFSQMLLCGVSLDKIIQEDQSNAAGTVENCQAVVKASVKVSEKVWADGGHYRQVTKLALKFFDGLKRAHKLGGQERCWLECAAILHDIGLSKAIVAHNKKTAKLILNNPALHFTSYERRIVASIARYHRGGLPKPKHAILATLDQETIHKVKVLASLLRVADGLDYTHKAMVKRINFKISDKTITVECYSDTKPLLEAQAFNKKKDLFEKVFARKLVLTWKQRRKLPTK